MTSNHRLLDQDLIFVFCQKNLTWDKLHTSYVCNSCYSNNREMYINNNSFAFTKGCYSFRFLIKKNRNFYWYITRLKTPIFSNLVEGVNFLSLKDAKILYDRYINLLVFV